jgi:Uma2 family endonuclease
VQKKLIVLFSKWEQHPGLFALPELRGKTSETRFRIPDVSVFLGAEPEDEVPERPPFIAVEILSPDDKLNSLLGKFEEYRAWGVAHIWLVNPMARTLHSYTSDGLIKQSALRIPEFSLSIAPEEVFPPECVSQ